MPCEVCCEHFALYVSRNPPLVDSRSNLFRWTVEAHNHVNRFLGLQAEWSISQAYIFYIRQVKDNVMYDPIEETSPPAASMSEGDRPNSTASRT